MLAVSIIIYSPFTARLICCLVRLFIDVDQCGLHPVPKTPS